MLIDNIIIIVQEINRKWNLYYIIDEKITSKNSKSDILNRNKLSYSVIFFNILLCSHRKYKTIEVGSPIKLINAYKCT